MSMDMSVDSVPPATPEALDSLVKDSVAEAGHGIAINQLVAPESSETETAKIVSPGVEKEEPVFNQDEDMVAQSLGADSHEPVRTATTPTLKRSSPEDEQQIDGERSAKRVKEDDDDEAMDVVPSSPAGAVETKPVSASEAVPSSPGASGLAPEAAIASQQEEPVAQPSQPEASQSSSVPDATNPVDDPALLPPPSLYLPGSYLPPSRPRFGSDVPLTLQQYRSLINVIKTVKKQKESFAFVVPVDPVYLQIPHYFNIIKKPMDLGTVEQKLLASNPAPGKQKATRPEGQKLYSNVADVVEDVRQVWANTRIFNGPEHAISQNADLLDKLFETAIEKAKLHENPPAVESVAPLSARSHASVPAEDHSHRARRPSVSQMPAIRRNPSDEIGESSRPKREIHAPTPVDSTWQGPAPTLGKSRSRNANSPRMKAASRAINELLTKKQYFQAAGPFFSPVDPIALGIPSYPEVIKRPMDLSTIQSKIAGEQYNDAGGVNADVKLMIRNCFTFNPPGTPVHTCGEELQKIWQEKWRGVVAVPEHEEEDDPALNQELEQLERQKTEIQTRIDQIRRMKADKGKPRAKPSQSAAVSKPSKSSTSAPAIARPQPSKTNRPSKNGPSTSKPKKATNGKSEHRDYGDSDEEEDAKVYEAPTLAQKQELADKIADADPDTLMQALELITRTTSLGNHNDEIELDIDALPPHTIAQLYDLVIRGIQPGEVKQKKKTGPKPGSKRPGRKPGMGNGPKSGKGGVEAERIKALEAELNRLNGANSSDEGDSDQDDDDEEGEYGNTYSEEEG